MKRFAAVVAALLIVVAAGCDRNDLIGSPQNGQIVPGDTVTVTGVLPDDLALGGTIEANGVTTTVAADRTWSVDIPHATSGYVTPVEVTYTPPSGPAYRQRTAVVHADKVDDGQMSSEGVGMRFTNAGLAGLGPVIESLAGGAFDIGGLLMEQNPIINQQDAFLTLDIVGNVYEAGIGGVTLSPQSTEGGVATPISISDLYVGVNLNITDGGLINIACGLELQIPQTAIDAVFDLEPTSGDESKVDVNMIGTPTVDTGTVGYEFISGICDGDTFVIGDIVDAVAGPQVQALVGDGFATNLGDPDGAGPGRLADRRRHRDRPRRDLHRRLGRRGDPGPPRRAVHGHRRDRLRHRLPGGRRLLRHPGRHARRLRAGARRARPGGHGRRARRVPDPR